MLNCVAIMGRLAFDPHMRQTTTGKSVATFRIACDRGRKDARGQMLTDWLDVVAWDRLGEFVCQYFEKGQMIAVTGRLQSRSYQDKNGNNRTAVEIVASSLNFVGSKAAANSQQNAGYAAPTQPPAGTYEPKLTGQGDDDFALIEDDGDLSF